LTLLTELTEACDMVQTDEPSSLPAPADRESQAKPLYLLDEFVELTTAREVKPMLEHGLKLLVQAFGAEAGSILFPPFNLRVGAFRQEALEQVSAWEKAIAGQLCSAIWRLSKPGLPPITSRTLAGGDVTLVSSPLLSEARVIGCVSLIFPKTRTLSMTERQMLARLARGFGGMGSLLEQLHLTSQRLSQLNLFYQVGQALATTIDLNQLLKDTMELAASVLNASAASLMLIDEKTNELVFEVSHGDSSEALRSHRMGLNEGIAGWVAAHCEPTIVNDVTQDPRFNRRVDARTGFLTRSIAAVPLQIKGKTIGVLEVLNKHNEEQFDKEDIQLMLTIAGQAAIAIENARLYKSLREERDRIIKAQEEIRRELARNLHDGTVQLLAAIAMSMEHLERLLKFQPEAAYAELEALRRMVCQATRQARLVLFELRPIILETQGLVPTLRYYVEQLRESETFAIHFTADQDDPPLDPKATPTIFAIVQEAINNAKRHANARNVWLTLTTEGDTCKFSVRDDGQGFGVDTIEQDYAQRGSFGLLNMRERAELIEGKLTITSSTKLPDRGTVVTLEVPLQRRKT
jgi:signal transduction histidine kinase